MASSNRADSVTHAQLYARCNEVVQRLACKFVICDEATQDLVHDVFLLARSKISQFHGAAALDTWLYRIALNRFIDDRRRLRALPLEAERIFDPAARDAATAELDVRDALARLASDEQTVLKLRFEEGLDYISIAKATGMRPGTVSSRLHRARVRLGELLGSGYGRS